jgi:mycothiol synthase
VPEPHTHLALDLVLDLDAFDPVPFEPVRRSLRAQGIAFTTLAAELAGAPEAADALYALHNECRRRQPPVEMRAEPIPRERWDASFLTGPDSLPDGYVVAVDAGTPVGVSALHRVAEEPGALTAGFTGVLPSHSGRGVAVGLKLETIAYARAHGYRELRTSLLAENAAMLRVNERVGFRRVRERAVTHTY